MQAVYIVKSDGVLRFLQLILGCALLIGNILGFKDAR